MPDWASRPVPREGLERRAAGKKRQSREDGSRGKRGSYRTDDQTAEVLASMADPLAGSLQEIAEEAGISAHAAQKMVERLRGRGLLLDRALDGVSKKDTQQLYEHRAHQILSSITPENIAKANLMQKMTAAAIATDKGLLLSGQPTEILSVKQLDNLDQLGAFILKELERRGMQPQLDPTTQQASVMPGPYRKDPTDAWPDAQDEPR